MKRFFPFREANLHNNVGVMKKTKTIKKVITPEYWYPPIKVSGVLFDANLSNKDSRQTQHAPYLNTEEEKKTQTKNVWFFSFPFITKNRRCTTMVVNRCRKGTPKKSVFSANHHQGSGRPYVHSTHNTSDGPVLVSPKMPASTKKQTCNNKQ